MKNIIITKEEQGIKLFKLIKKMFPDMPDSLIYKLLRKKYFEINEKKATGKEELKNGDKISIFLSEETFNKYKNKISEDIQKENKNTSNNSVVSKLEIDKLNIVSHNYINRNAKDINILDKKRIVYEDENVIIYDKPVGMLSQSDSKEKVSLNDLLKKYIDKNNINENIIKSSGIVNRLDRNTEGLIIFAKNYISARELSKMIKDRKVEKRYKALVNGIIDKEEGDLINTYNKDSKKNIAKLGRVNLDTDNKDKDIIKLHYKVIKKYNNSTLVDINLITGKSHQIRAQFSYIGHPLVCDKKYMDINLYKKNLIEYKEKSQFLICYKIKFPKFENDKLQNLSNKEFIIDKTL